MPNEHSEPKGWPHGDEYDAWAVNSEGMRRLRGEWRRELERDISPTMDEMIVDNNFEQRLWDRYSALKRAGLIEVVPERRKPFVASRVPDSLEAWVDQNGGW